MHLKEKLIWNIDYETNKYPSEIKKVLFKTRKQALTITLKMWQTTQFASSFVRRSDVLMCRTTQVASSFVRMYCLRLPFQSS